MMILFQVLREILAAYSLRKGHKMRYTYNTETGVLKKVKYVTHEGQTVSNPPDELVDQLGAGYPLVEDGQPGYDPETQQLVLSYEMREGAIHKVWRAVEIPTPLPSLEERLAALEAENAALRTAIEEGVKA